jgi:hypothetical protein
MTCSCPQPDVVREPHGNVEFLEIVTCSREDCNDRRQGVGKSWTEHNVGANGRTVIAADWDPTGWNLFVYTEDRDPEQVYLEVDGVDAEFNASVDCWGEDRAAFGYALNAVPREVFLTADFFANGPCDLVIENAHLKARHDTSLAQVYWANELLTLFGLCDSDNLRVFEFPAVLAKRARLEAMFGATEKERDPEAVVRFCLRRRDVILRSFNPYHQLITPEGEELSAEQTAEAGLRRRMDDVRDNCNYRLNIMRQYQYQMPDEIDDPNYSRAREDIEDAFAILDARFGAAPAADAPAEELQIRQIISDYANIEQGDGNQVYRKIAAGRYSHPKLNTVMSVYATVFEWNEEGERQLRRHEGRFIGVDLIWDRILTMSPYHGKYGGVARANLVWYGLKMGVERGGVRIHTIEDEPEAYILRQSNRRDWRRCVKTLIRMFRDAGLGRGD